LLEQLIGFVTLPIESRSRLKQVDVESRLGAYLEEPLSKAQQLQHSQRAAKLAEEAALLLQASPAQELDMRNEEATRKAAGDARVAASSQGLDRLPQSAEDIERERKLGQREVVDVILSSKPSVFLPDSLPKEDKQRTTTELEAVTPEKPIAQRTATAKKIEEIAVVRRGWFCNGGGDIVFQPSLVRRRKKWLSLRRSSGRTHSTWLLNG
jgi:hypothetical protein